MSIFCKNIFHLSSTVCKISCNCNHHVYVCVQLNHRFTSISYMYLRCIFTCISSYVFLSALQANCLQLAHGTADRVHMHSCTTCDLIKLTSHVFPYLYPVGICVLSSYVFLSVYICITSQLIKLTCELIKQTSQVLLYLYPMCISVNRYMYFYL